VVVFNHDDVNVVEKNLKLLRMIIMPMLNANDSIKTAKINFNFCGTVGALEQFGV
jgi:hypothetical protein